MEGLANDLNEMLRSILVYGLKETTLQSEVMVDGPSVQQIQVFNELE